MALDVPSVEEVDADRPVRDCVFVFVPAIVGNGAGKSEEVGDVDVVVVGGKGEEKDGERASVVVVLSIVDVDACLWERGKRGVCQLWFGLVLVLGKVRKEEMDGKKE